ncbi:MAG TPA: glycosyltransferase [Polyangiaceae bacterium]
MIERTVVHYSQHDPREWSGGVETFGRRLARVFREVVYMTPATRDEARVRSQRLPVICDNQYVLDWPPDVPVIGFQHGVGALKALALPNRGTWRLALAQARAAKRPNTTWVACARWIADAFRRLHGVRGTKVLYHRVDLDVFDGRLQNDDSRLVLHDGRAPHKGSLVYPYLARAFPAYRFEPLDCPPEGVPERMRRAAAFVHLSSYEGNSIVCNEAMAMNLPCFFTRVGLFREDPAADVVVVPRRLVFGPVASFGRRTLKARFGEFLESLATKRYEPRRWVEENASFAGYDDAWRDVLRGFDTLSWS